MLATLLRWFRNVSRKKRTRNVDPSGARMQRQDSKEIFSRHYMTIDDARNSHRNDKDDSKTRKRRDR